MRETWTILERRYPHLVHRPLLACLPAFFGGLLGAQSAPTLLVALGSIFLARRFLPLASLLFVAGFIRGATMFPEQTERLRPGAYTVVGRIVATPAIYERSQGFICDLGGRYMLVYAPRGQQLIAGDLIEAAGEVSNITSPGPAAFWRRRGINQQMSATFVGGVGLISPGAGWAAWGSGWRNLTYQRLRRDLPSDQASMAMGIVAGQQGMVRQEIVDQMERTGTLHLLATSGYNVFLLAFALLWFLSRSPLPRLAQVAVVMFVLVIYAAAEGGRPPVARATLMAAIFLGMAFFRRSPDALSALGASAIVYLLAEPAGVYDAGFHLSFVTVAGLLLFGPAAFDRLRNGIAGKLSSRAQKLIFQACAGVLLTTFIAQLASAPLTAAHFGIVSLVSPLANVATALAVPLVYIGVAASQIAEPFSLAWASTFDVLITGSFAGWIQWVNEKLASPDWAAAVSPSVPTPAILMYYFTALALSSPFRPMNVEEALDA